MDHKLACKEVRHSRSFMRVLEVVLAYGNYLNWGSRLGSVAAFR
jgi:hypothetical protein